MLPKVPTAQAAHASKAFIDPTGGKISDALKKAADKVELENVPAKEALDEAQKAAQEELDKVNNKFYRSATVDGFTFE